MPQSLLAAMHRAATRPVPRSWIHGYSDRPFPAEVQPNNRAGPLITPREAKKIVVDQWFAYMTAINELDTRAATQLVVPGIMLRESLEQCAWPHGTYCPQEQWTLDYPSPDVRVFMPRETSYPLYFLAEFHTAGDIIGGDDSYVTRRSVTALVVFERTSRRSIWKIAFKTAFRGPAAGQSPAFSVPRSRGRGRSGYDPSPTVNPPIPDQDVLPALARYWSHWKTYDAPPAGYTFVRGAYTSQFGRALGADPNGTVFTRHGALLVERGTYSVDPTADGTWTFSVNDRQALICGTIRVTATDVALGSPRLFQGNGGNPWGPTIPPGRYAAIGSMWSHRTCVLAETGGRLVVYGADGDSWMSVGVK